MTTHSKTVLAKCLLLLAALVAALPACASLNDIQKQKLPQNPAIMKAMAEVSAVEDMVWEWTEKWPYDAPKEKVVATLSTSLAELKKQTEAAPDNVELLLLTALVAHYAHNVDVDGAAQTAIDLLERVHKLAPNEYRYGWFLGLHYCQIAHIKEGTDLMLSVESSMEWQRLPAGFWDDYIFCAEIANMPAHELRAADHLSKLKAPASARRDSMIEVAVTRQKTPDIAATYPFKDVWTSDKNIAGLTFFNSMFGLAVWSKGEWRVEPHDITQGMVTVQFLAGPHTGKAGNVSPGLIVRARQPKPGETLSDFLIQAWPNGPVLKPANVVACPVRECLAAEAVQPGTYGPNGDGHFLFTAFQRDEPEFPGLMFEAPHNLPQSETPGMQYFHPADHWHRFRGTIYYLVVLDTAESAFGDAKQDYTAFLKGIRVE